MSYLDPVGQITAAILIQRIESELTQCRSLLSRIEDAVETMLSSGRVAKDDPLHISEMQTIDLLDQSIADLAICLQDLALAAPIQNSEPLRLSHVTHRMRLADLRDRLNGRESPANRGDKVELF